MAKHQRERRGIKGTDVYLAVICGLVVWFVWYSAQTYHEDGAWFPIEITIGVWILALYEVFALLRVKLVKEGEPDEHGIIAGTYSRIKGWINGKAPIELPDTEIDVEIAKQQEQSRQEDANGQIDKP